MRSFLQYLVEEKSKAIPHLMHLAGESHFFSKDENNNEMDRLEHLHKYLSGDKSDVTSVGVKADGSPSFEAGYVNNPKTGSREFGVAYKGAARGYAFDKNDIQEKFGHAPGLASKMGQILEHGSKVISPIHGVVQGDFMGSNKDKTIQKEGNKISQRENLIKYSYPANSEEGKSLQNSKISLALHTRIDKSEREYNIDTSKLHQHSDVHMFDQKFAKEESRHHYDDQAEFEKHFNNAKKSFGNIRDHDGLVEGHTDHLQTYINKTVRTGDAPNAAGYRKHLQERLQKDVDKVKMPKTKATKKQKMDSMLHDTDEHKDQFTHLFAGHRHLEKARNVLLKSLESSPQKQEQTINGQDTKPEGFVVSYKDNSARKVVNRSKDGFSGQNLNK
jgi:hypothetical protein